MSLQAVTVIVLIAIFLLGTLRNINLGILGLAGAFLVGYKLPAFNEDGADPLDSIFAGFPVDLMFALMGLTYLFGFAQHNGTISLLLNWCMRLVRGNRAVMPWIFFVITGAFMSIGAIFCIGVISPLALPFARRYRINPLMMGMMVVHGGMAGLLSPLSVYGIFVNGTIQNAGLEASQTLLFIIAMLFNVLMGLLVYIFLGGRKLIGQQWDASMEIRSEGDQEEGTSTQVQPFQWLTLASLAGLAVGAGIFNLDIGLLSIILGAILAVIKPGESVKALNNVSWGTIVLVGGMVTYIEVLEAAGTVDSLSRAITALGAPALGLLLMCYLSGIVSALASSIATIGIAMSMATPFLTDGTLPVVGTAAAIAISATVVDVSPFSTNGAMVLANVHPGQRDRVFKQMLIYSGVVIAFSPLMAWLLVFLPF
ncbi:SLC13 family permease [Corynebacterium sp. KPL2850]|jgi:hypothetical protein|uniref:SLC13 family permease n=1 Tax=Corynebacterium sp. KPL2850 TaxID=3158318 RepID=UPI0032ECE2A5